MRSAGMDPYERYVLSSEIEEAMREARRPVCDTCGDRILDSKCYKIGPYTVCEECVKDAWDTLQKQLILRIHERLGAHSDWSIMEILLEFMLNRFDLNEFGEEYAEEISDER